MLEKILITALIVMFIWATMLEGMIFGKIRQWLAALTEFYQKPIFDCPICMVPWYGSIVYWVIWGNSWQEWLIVIFAAAGLNTVFVKLFPDK
jgi:hypothetical protein